MSHTSCLAALGVLVAALAFESSARAERAAVADTAGEAESENLISGKPTFGGYGGPEIKGTPIQHVGSALVGGQGGMILNHVLVIGGAGYGLVTRSDAPAELQTPGVSRRLDFGYGGMRVEYLILPRALVHGAVGALVGGGGVAWQGPDGAYGTSTHSDAFFVVEPQIAVELNVHKLVRFAAVGSYRWLSGIDSAGLTNADFRGLAFGAVTKIGVF